MSVSETTPVSRPDRCAPGRAEAGTDVNPGTLLPLPPGTGIGECGPAVAAVAVGVRTVDSRRGCVSLVPFVVAAVPPILVPLGDLEWPWLGGEVILLLDTEDVVCTGASSGVCGADGDGDGESTTHIRCARVATNFATVWARVECGLTWKTGKESRPSSTPRSDKMTEIKCMQDDCNSGKLVREVRCWTSLVEMLPTTLSPLSTTATDVKPSLFINVRTSESGRSALLEKRTKLASFATSVYSRVKDGQVLDGDNFLRAKTEISQISSIESVNRREVDRFVPEEVDQMQLAQDAHNFCRIGVGHNDTAGTAAKSLNGCEKIITVRQGRQWLLVANGLDIPDWDGDTILSSLCYALAYGHVLWVGVGHSDDDKKIRIEVAVVKSRHGDLVRRAVAEEHSARSVVVSEEGLQSSALFLSASGRTTHVSKCGLPLYTLPHSYPSPPI